MGELLEFEFVVAFVAFTILEFVLLVLPLNSESRMELVRGVFRSKWSLPFSRILSAMEFYLLFFTGVEINIFLIAVSVSVLVLVSVSVFSSAVDIEIATELDMFLLFLSMFKPW